MRPGRAALCTGSVHHRRTEPNEHSFTYPVSQVWIDPDRPQELTDLHPAWSASRPAPVRFRRSDYGPADRPDVALGDATRDDVADVLGHRPTGPVRMVTQLRRWGWLFNPITIFFAWAEADSSHPDAAVLEVTNTPWKERHRYPIALERGGDGYTAVFDKTLHVSPFLDERFHYDLALADADDRVELSIDARRPGEENPTVLTQLSLERRPATRAALTESLRAERFPTHRVSAGIHRQALELARKRVPFVPHPKRNHPEKASLQQ